MKNIFVDMQLQIQKQIRRCCRTEKCLVRRSTKSEEIKTKLEKNPSLAQGKKLGKKPKDKRRGSITFDGWLKMTHQCKK